MTEPQRAEWGPQDLFLGIAGMLTTVTLLLAGLAAWGGRSEPSLIALGLGYAAVTFWIRYGQERVGHRVLLSLTWVALGVVVTLVLALAHMWWYAGCAVALLATKDAPKPPSELLRAGDRTRREVPRWWTTSGLCATIVAMTTVEPLRSVRDHLSEVVDRVQRHHERVIITRNGQDAAVVISPEDLAQLEETIAVLSDPEALDDIREADAAYDRGDVVRGVEAVRQLRRD